MVLELPLCLGHKELEIIPKDVAEKIERHFALKQSVNDDLNSQIEFLKADYTQKCYELDKKIIEASSTLEKELLNTANVSKQNEELQASLIKIKKQFEELEETYCVCQGENVALKRVRDELQQEKLSIEHMLQKREVELTRVTEECKSYSQKLTESVGRKNEIEMKLDELQASSVTFEYQIKKLEQEKEQLSSENQQLSQEIVQLNSQTSAVKLEKSNELINLRSRLEVKMDEFRVLSANADNLKKTNIQYQDKINDLLEKSSKMQEERASMEQLYRTELQSQTKLADLYKAASEDATAKADELASAVTEVQKIISSSSEANVIAQQQISELEIRNTNLQKEITDLKKELERANDIVTAVKSGRSVLTEDELNKLCPTAAITSKFITSGMTLTEIYSKYMEASDDLDIVKQENKRLNEAMDAILTELNEKAPVLKQQREDYERALATISQLTSQMDNAVIECQHLQTKSDDANRKHNLAKRDIERLQKETADLSKQVQYLLKEMSEIKGGTVTMGSHSSDISMQDDQLSSTVITSSDAISAQLVTFKDISELQQQNKKLLAIIRELSEEREKEETLMTDKRIKELSLSLEGANEELTTLREERVRQGDLVEALVKQRDMYRVLLANDPNTTIPPTMLANPGLLNETSASKSLEFTSPKRQSIKESELSKALSSLQEEYKEYKIQSAENIKLYKEQNEKLYSEVSELRSSNAKHQASAEFITESSNILKQNIETLKSENKILRDKNTEYQMLLQKHEITLMNTTNELAVVQQSKSKFENNLISARSEVDALKRTEERLRSEITFLKKEQRGQNVLLANLQKVQQTVEHQEFDLRSQMRKQIEDQEHEIKSLRQNLREVTDDKQSSVQSVEKQLLVLQTQLETETEALQKTQKLLNDEEVKYQDSQLKNNQLQSKLSTIEQRMKNLSANKGIALSSMSSTVTGTEEVMKELQDENEAIKEELSALKLRLEKANLAIKQQRSIATAAEESLKQANLANKELSDALNSRLSSANDQIIRVEQKVAELHSENQKLSSNKSSLINEVDRQTESLNKQIVTLQTELTESLNRLKSAQKCEQDARNELQQQAAFAKEANDSYQREMILHATDVQELMKLKEENKKHDNTIHDYKTKINDLQSQLDSQKAILENVIRSHQKEIEDISLRKSELEKQNSMLHERIEYLSKQLSEAQLKVSKTPRYLSPVKPVSSTYEDDGKQKSDEQLMDIVKYLRKEKNLSETKLEVSESESKRLKHQIGNLESQLLSIQEKLEVEREKAKKYAEKEMEHESVMKKVETLNVLTDSNRLLRDERDRIVIELNKMTDLADSLQNRLSPLQAENKDLTMQNSAMKSEKNVLEQDVQRWQQRAQSLMTSSKRQDPEETKRLQNEKQQLMKTNELLAKELLDKKNEVSTLNGQLRNLENKVETMKIDFNTTTKKLETADKDNKAKSTEIEEKTKTINQIRRVGRRYKQLYEDLQKKNQEAEKETAVKATEAENVSVDQKSEDSAKMALVEASLLRANTAKAELQKQITAANSTIAENEKKMQALNNEIEQLKESSNNKDSDSSEIQKLKDEKESLKKILNDKEEKGKKLLTMAKTRIESMRKELAESNAERERLKNEDTKLREQIELLKTEARQSTETHQKLQNKVEELQKQLNILNAHQQQQQKLTKENRGHHSASSGAGDRKAANVRPITTTLVSQVSPLRVTRTARVMPEPQQESGDANVAMETNSVRGSSPQTHSSTSHSTTGTISHVVPQSSSQPTRAFVHPTRHRAAAAIVTPAASSDTPRPEPQQTEATTARSPPEPRQTNEASGYVAAASSSTGSTGNTVSSEYEQAIVSSSDDQTVFHDDDGKALQINQQSASSTGTSSQQGGSTASDTAPSSSMVKVFPNRVSSQKEDAKTSNESGSNIVTASSSNIQIARPSVQERKRAHDDATEEDHPAASSSDSKSVTPLSKRQRNSPDQSSESAIDMTITATSQSSTTETQKSASNNVNTVPETSTIENKNIPDSMPLTRIQPIRPLMGQSEVSSNNQFPVTSSSQPVRSTSSPVGQAAACIITTSGEQQEELAADEEEETNAIVISSDEESVGNDGNNEAEGIEFEEEYQDPMLDEVSESHQPVISDSPNMEMIESSSGMQGIRPDLVIHPPPPDSVPRNRLPSRPAPLTPGLVPTSNEDGDGIVPCTPTLPTHSVYDNYQTISSPHVPSVTGPPIQFRFEDVSVPGQSSIGAQRGLGTVDNTLMDIGGTEEEAPQTIPNPEVTSVENEATYSRSMVSSSFVEEMTEDKSATEHTLQEDDPSSSEVQEQPIRNLQNLRGRRIRLIKSRPRGRGGGNSPTPSNNN